MLIVDIIVAQCLCDIAKSLAKTLNVGINTATMGKLPLYKIYEGHN